MSEQQASIGRIVHYRLSEWDVRDADLHSGKPAGVALNGLKAGDYCPAMVVRTWPGSAAVNLRVMVDGPVSTMWKTSIAQGDGEGQWTWPPRVG